MKATVERATLLKCLAHVQSVVERRNTIPILSNLLMRGEKTAGFRLMPRPTSTCEIVETVAAHEIETPGRHDGAARTRSTTSCASCATARRSSSRRTG
jgi:DNA polymerase-3 subunit beta